MSLQKAKDDNKFNISKKDIGFQDGYDDLKDEKLRRLKEYNGDDKVISSVERLAQISSEQDNAVRFKTGLKKLDEAIDGLEGGELIAVTGRPKSGKTLLAQTITKNIKKNNINSLWFQYEIPDRQFLTKFGEDMPYFYLPQHLKGKKLSWIEERILEAIEKFDIKLVIIDNIHFLIDYERGNNITVEIGSIVRQLKSIAIENNIAILVLSHAKRLATYQSEDENMFRDSSSLPAESDKAWIVKRIPNPVTGEYGNDAKVIVALDRQTGSMYKEVLLSLDSRGFLAEIVDKVDIFKPEEENLF